MADINGVLRQPFAEQVAFFRNKLQHLIPTNRYDDIRNEQHDIGFMVAGATKADLLADLSRSIEKAISQGVGIEQWRKEFFEAVEKHNWHGWTGESTKAGQAWRTRVIYQTNAQTSYSAGRFAQLTEGEFKYWVYHHNDSVKNPRLQHLAWDGMALPPSDPFWQAHYPPNGWGCQCYVTGARSERAVIRQGGRLDKQPPADALGVDKDWRYAPGASVASTVNALAKKLERYPSRIATDLLGSNLSSEAFARWLAEPTPNSAWPVGVVNAAHAQRIGAQTTVVGLSSETAKKQLREHPEIQPAEYVHVQAALQDGWVVQDGANTLIYVLESERYVSVVKSTKTGKGLFLTSFRRLSGQQAKKDAELARLRRKENKE